MNKNFIPCYVWPNKSFPFRVYFNDEKGRIFIIENLQHNFEWIQDCHDKFRKNDHFLVIVGWHYHEWLVEEASRMFEALTLSKDNFHILFNDERERSLFQKYGFNGDLINQNAFLDENQVMRPINTEKIYDAIAVARLVEFKRHFLAANVPNLALVAGESHGSMQTLYVPPHIYLNESQLSPDEVCEKINQSKCGLILSEAEGACFSSSEYLLCGVPVVSTISEGGRDVWYNEYNSKVVAPEPQAIRDAVDFFVSNPRDPNIIRNSHIELAGFFRNNFINLTKKIFIDCAIDYVDAKKYFEANFFHKMRHCYSPHFNSIFN